MPREAIGHEKAADVLYHGSPKRYEILKPRNLHGDPGVGDVVFASPYRRMALPYTGREWGNRDLGQGGFGMKDLYMAEMRPGALDDTYKGAKGYLHTLPPDLFKPEKTKGKGWEQVAHEPVKPLKIEQIKNAIRAMLDEGVRLIPYDPDSREFQASLRNSAKHMEGMAPQARNEHMRWWAEKATPEVRSAFKRLGLMLPKQAAVKKAGAFEELKPLMELIGSRGRALKAGRSMPENRDWDWGIFTDDRSTRAMVLGKIRELRRRGWKLTKYPGAFTASSPQGTTDVNLFSAGQKPRIMKAWDLMESGVPKNEAWAQIDKSSAYRSGFMDKRASVEKLAGAATGKLDTVRQLYRMIRRAKRLGYSSDMPVVSGVDLLAERVKGMTDLQARNYARELGRTVIPNAYKSKMLISPEDAAESLLKQEQIRNLPGIAEPVDRLVSFGSADVFGKFRRGRPVPNLTGEIPGVIWMNKFDPKRSLNTISSHYHQHFSRPNPFFSRPAALIVDKPGKVVVPHSKKALQQHVTVPYDDPSLTGAKIVHADPGFIIANDSRMSHLLSSKHLGQPFSAAQRAAIGVPFKTAAYDQGFMDKMSAITLDIEKGDTLLGGRFKNVKHIVKDIGTDELGQPTVNGMKLLSFRIAKRMGKQAAGLSDGTAVFLMPLETQPEESRRKHRLKGPYWHTGIIQDGKVYEAFSGGRHTVSEYDPGRFAKAKMVKVPRVSEERLEAEFKKGLPCDNYVNTVMGWPLTEEKDEVRINPIPQKDIYQTVRKVLPEGVVHASGGLPDARGLSDVDLAMISDTPRDLAGLMPEGTETEHGGDHSIYHIPGYGRPVNLYVAADPDLAMRGHRHRSVELALAEKYPALAEAAYRRKQEGLGTEPAWAEVLGLKGDPYEALLDDKAVMSAAEAAVKIPEKPRPLDLMLQAKARSDVEDYATKHAIMRKLMLERPDEFGIDSTGRGVHGITHAPTNFRMHLPIGVVPENIKAAFDFSLARAILNETRETA